MGLTPTDVARWRELDVHKHGRRWRHRLDVNGTKGESFDTPDACYDRIRDIRAAAATGRPVPAIRRDRDETLAAWAGRLYARRVAGLTPNGARALRYSFRPWLEGELAGVPLRLLGLLELEDAYRIRWAAAPAIANRELGALHAILRYAEPRGATFDRTLLLLEPLELDVRRRKALTIEQLEWFAALPAALEAPRLILTQGTVGNRLAELLTLTDDRCHLDGAAPCIVIPAELCKEQREKIIPLMPDEAELLREQRAPHAADGSPTSHLPPRAPNPAGLMFPRADGTPWPVDGNEYRRAVMRPAARAAAAAWPSSWGPSPFPDFTSHDLRATAITLARDADVPEDAVAIRVGHADAGELIRTIYDQSSRVDRARRAFTTYLPDGLRGRARAAGATLTGAPAARRKRSPSGPL